MQTKQDEKKITVDSKKEMLVMKKCPLCDRRIFDTISLCFEIDDELYNQLTEILAPQGLTLEKAIELFLRETVRLGRIPFEYTDEDIAAATAMHEKKK